MRTFLIILISFTLGILTTQLPESKKFVWEGLNKDIPKDGNVCVQFTTNEGVIYINPIDE